MLLTRVAAISRRMMIFSGWSNWLKGAMGSDRPQRNLFLFIQTLRLLLQRPISNPISLIGNMCFSNEAEKTNKNVASLKERAACCICMHRRCHGRQTISAALCDASLHLWVHCCYWCSSCSGWKLTKCPNTAAGMKMNFRYSKIRGSTRHTD